MTISRGETEVLGEAKMPLGDKLILKQDIRSEKQPERARPSGKNKKFLTL
jgi:hypothetical protein